MPSQVSGIASVNRFAAISDGALALTMIPSTACVQLRSRYPLLRWICYLAPLHFNISDQRTAGSDPINGHATANGLSLYLHRRGEPSRVPCLLADEADGAEVAYLRCVSLGGGRPRNAGGVSEAEKKYMGIWKTSTNHAYGCPSTICIDFKTPRCVTTSIRY